jgi:hypothetical protein
MNIHPRNFTLVPGRRHVTWRKSTSNPPYSFPQNFGIHHYKLWVHPLAFSNWTFYSTYLDELANIRTTNFNTRSTSWWWGGFHRSIKHSRKSTATRTCTQSSVTVSTNISIAQQPWLNFKFAHIFFSQHVRTCQRSGIWLWKFCRGLHQLNQIRRPRFCDQIFERSTRKSCNETLT